MIDLVLERRDQADATPRVGPVAITPALGEDYWSYRVRLTETQAVLAFPKFGTFGIGMAVEEDWNTNLSYVCQAIDVTSHIWCNAHAGDPDYFADPEEYDPAREISVAAVYRAVEMLQAAIGEDHPDREPPASRSSMLDHRWTAARIP